MRKLMEARKLDAEKLLTAQITSINLTDKLQKMIKIVDESRTEKQKMLEKVAGLVGLEEEVR